MPAFIDENQQFIDPETNAPIVNGQVFFGVQGDDPTVLANRITVFTDRGLTTPINQPIATDAAGRTSVKIWIPGRYSFAVLTSVVSGGTQKLIDEDAGSTEAVGTTVLTVISGANIITASADPVLTELVNGEQFTLTAIAVNTDKMTIDIDGTGAKPLKFNFNEEMAPGFIQANQTLNFTYNSTGAPTTDFFVWDNEGRGISILTNVAIVIGTDPNTITADGGPSVAGNVADQLYSFKVDTTNDDKVTLKIGTLTAVAIKNKGADLLPGQLLADIIYIVSFLPGSPDTFEVVSGLPLSSPGPIGNTNANNVDSLVLTAATSIQVASGQTITTLGDTAALDGSDNKIPTNLTVQEAIAAATANPGKILQVKTVLSSAKIQSTTAIPVDDTIPQIGEGTEVMTLAITPLVSTSTIIVIANCSGAGQLAATYSIALFQDAIANALAAEFWQFSISGGSPISYGSPLTLMFSHVANNMTARTYRIRFGPSGTGGGGNATFNGKSNVRVFGTTPKSSIVIMEIGT